MSDRSPILCQSCLSPRYRGAPFELITGGSLGTVLLHSLTESSTRNPVNAQYPHFSEGIPSSSPAKTASFHSHGKECAGWQPVVYDSINFALKLGHSLVKNMKWKSYFFFTDFGISKYTARFKQNEISEV